MTDKGKCLCSPRIFVWFKEPFITTNASRVLIDQNDCVIDFVERVIKEDQLEHATTTKPSLFCDGCVRSCDDSSAGGWGS